MIVYHGTGTHNEPGFRTSRPRVARRSYLKSRSKDAFCTSGTLAEAEKFAVRKTTGDELAQGKTGGLVLEFELNGIEGRDWVHAVDSHTMHEEDEIAVLNVRSLKIVAIHRMIDGQRVREPFDIAHKAVREPLSAALEGRGEPLT